MYCKKIFPCLIKWATFSKMSVRVIHLLVTVTQDIQYPLVRDQSVLTTIWESFVIFICWQYPQRIINTLCHLLTNLPQYFRSHLKHFQECCPIYTLKGYLFQCHMNLKFKIQNQEATGSFKNCQRSIPAWNLSIHTIHSPPQPYEIVFITGKKGLQDFSHALCCLKIEGWNLDGREKLTHKFFCHFFLPILLKVPQKAGSHKKRIPLFCFSLV